MFQAAENAGALQAAHVNGCVTEHFTGRASERSRVETIGQQIAILGHDRHHRSEVDVETEHAQNFTGDSSERAGRRKVAVLANRTSGRHRSEDAAQSIDEPAFLIDANQGRRRQYFADAVEQRAELLWTSDVASENNDAARFNFLD